MRRRGRSGLDPTAPLSNEPNGTMVLEAAANTIKPDGFHFATTRLLALEN